MASSAGMPIANFTWNDKSGASTDTLYTQTEEGLFVPFSFILAERGQPNVPFYGAGADMVPNFGSSTFDESSKFFQHTTRFLATAMDGCGCYAMRLVDPTAQTAAVGLFMQVQTADIVQYELDDTGARKVDANGNWIPQTTTTGTGDSQVTTNVTEPGIKITYEYRALKSGETYNGLTNTTIAGTDGAADTTEMPVIGSLVTSPGSYGNRQGYTLESVPARNTTLEASLKSVLYRFIPMELPTAVSTTASVIADNLGSDYNDVVFADVAVDPTTDANYAFNFVLGNRYEDSDTGDNMLPFDLAVYGDTFTTVGEQILAVSPELVSAGVTAAELDLISGQDADGNYYQHVEIETNSQVGSGIVIYNQGGTDGTCSKAQLEQMINDWISGSDHGEFGNVSQHPFTHIVDSGFSMTTKMNLFDLLGLRDNLAIDFTTQDVALPQNTEAEDISAGQSLLYRSQMYPESTVNGVGCVRVGIYGQSSKLVSGTAYTGNVPFSLNRLVQRRDLDGGSYIKGSSGGLPNSAVTLFRKPAWTADNTDVRGTTWASCINATMYADRKTLFYPCLRTVYPNDTSLLSDDEVKDRVIYGFKIARLIWAKYSGVRRPPVKLYPLIQRDIDNAFAAAFTNDDIQVTSTIFQSPADANLGYAVSCNLQYAGDMPMRVMNFNVILERAAATSSSSSSS